jgi:hypothetical protein
MAAYEHFHGLEPEMLRIRAFGQSSGTYSIVELRLGLNQISKHISPFTTRTLRTLEAVMATSPSNMGS